MKIEVEYAREFDHPLPEDDIIPWGREMTRAYGECPESGKINGHAWHRVKRVVVRTNWTPG